jgi:hypothetical protein
MLVLAAISRDVDVDVDVDTCANGALRSTLADCGRAGASCPPALPIVAPASGPVPASNAAAAVEAEDDRGNSGGWGADGVAPTGTTVTVPFMNT